MNARLETAIRGLECCKRLSCFSCPYNDGIDDSLNCRQSLINDIQALLKAQEARIMTLDEASSHLGEPVWVEEKDVDTVYCEILFDVDGKAFKMTFGMIEFGNVLTAHTTFSVVFYGDTFRFWTARPTNEQREETPWG